MYKSIHAEFQLSNLLNHDSSRKEINFIQHHLGIATTLTAKMRRDIMGQNHRVQCTLGSSSLQMLSIQHALQKAIHIKNETLGTELQISMKGSMLGFASAWSTI